MDENNTDINSGYEVVYDPSKMNPSFHSIEALAGLTALYQQAQEEEKKSPLPKDGLFDLLPAFKGETQESRLGFSSSSNPHTLLFGYKDCQEYSFTANKYQENIEYITVIKKDCQTNKNCLFTLAPSCDGDVREDHGSGALPYYKHHNSFYMVSGDDRVVFAGGIYFEKGVPIIFNNNSGHYAISLFRLIQSGALEKLVKCLTDAGVSFEAIERATFHDYSPMRIIKGKDGFSDFKLGVAVYNMGDLLKHGMKAPFEMAACTQSDNWRTNNTLKIQSYNPGFFPLNTQVRFGANKISGNTFFRENQEAVQNRARSCSQSETFPHLPRHTNTF